MTTGTIAGGCVDPGLYGQGDSTLSATLAVAPRAREFTAADRALAAASRAGARATRAASPLRTNFLDASHWADLASERGLRLPVWGTPCTTAAMTRWLKRAGLSVAWYRSWSGYQSLQQWIDANPLWPLRAWAGICLEERESADYHAARRAAMAVPA